MNATITQIDDLYFSCDRETPSTVCHSWFGEPSEMGSDWREKKIRLENPTWECVVHVPLLMYGDSQEVTSEIVSALRAHTRTLGLIA